MKPLQPSQRQPCVAVPQLPFCCMLGTKRAGNRSADGCFICDSAACVLRLVLAPLGASELDIWGLTQFPCQTPFCYRRS
jgi:hypothetical protein